MALDFKGKVTMKKKKEQKRRKKRKQEKKKGLRISQILTERKHD